MVPFPFDLNELWKERSGLIEFKLRDQAYHVYESAYLGRSLDKKQQYVTWRPQMIDSDLSGDSLEDRALVNLVRQITNHHQASFSRPPRTWNVPYSSETQTDADQKTAIILGVFRRSRIKSQQPLQSWRLSNRGDACMGLEWGKGENGTKPFIQVRSYDPAKCYPDMDREDMGGMHDLLYVDEVRKDWAEKTFDIQIGGQSKSVRMFTYWTTQCRYVQVENWKIDAYSFDHGLGFVPWRWIYNIPNGFMAQSDVAEVPKLQQLLSDALLLSLDAARKRIDKAYWGRGIAGDVTPKPGEVVTFPNPQAEINEFPTADPPEMLKGIMNDLQSFAQQMGGISPISMEGLAHGSIVTGAAVRHQVEAIEARTETKRVSLEHAYAILGEYILRVLEKAFPDEELIVQLGDKAQVAMKGTDIKAWYTCEASYGGFEGMGPMERGRWALEGLGRLHDDHEAIRIAYPDADVEKMIHAIADFQIRQASVTGQAQAVAQQGAQQGQQGQPPGQGGGAAGGPPAPGTGMPGGPQTPPVQMREGPTPPGQPQVAEASGRQMIKLSELEGLVNIVRDRLHGAVWAVGEIAIAGQSMSPRVMVEKKEDQGTVADALQSKNVKVTSGTPDKEEPKVSLL